VKLRSLVLILLACSPALADTTPPPLHVVDPIDLPTGVERDGRLEARNARRVLLDLEAFGGRLVVTEVHPALRSGGAVEAGATLVRIDPAPLERELRAAREALVEARRALTLEEQEGALEQAATRDALEQAEVAARTAKRALERFQALDGPQLLAGAAQALAATQHYVDDQRDELAQLELMYKGTELAPETKEIVLERGRRNLRHAERALEQQRRAHQTTVEWEHPDRLRALTEHDTWASRALAQARDRAHLASERRANQLRVAQQRARDIAEHAAQLDADLRRLVVTAPIGGVLEAVDLRVGDLLSPGRTLTQVHDTSRLVVRFAASEDDLRLLAPGGKVKLRLLAFGEVNLAGVVGSVEAVPSAPGEAPTYSTVVDVQGAHPLVRVGLRCRVVAAGSLVRRALVVPRAAVSIEGGRARCKVWANDRATPVEVILGPGNADNVQVLRGLVAGDAVVLPEAP
jgi:multidrug resistance efflux pump